VLCDSDIEQEIRLGNLQISPYDSSLLQPASIDIRLGETFLIDGKLSVTGSRFISVNMFMLGHSLETVRIPPDLTARVEGKSTWGRKGLLVHLTAGFIDPGFEGQITLELKNLSNKPIRLEVGTPIAQLSFSRLSKPARRPYGHPELNSHYQGQLGATPSYEPK